MFLTMNSPVSEQEMAERKRETSKYARRSVSENHRIAKNEWVHV